MSIEKVLQRLRGNINYPRQIPLFSVCSILLSEGEQTQLDVPSFYRLMHTFPIHIADSDIELLVNELNHSNKILIADFVNKLLVCTSFPRSSL